MTSESETRGDAVDIVRLGAEGDGVADLPSGVRFVPFALPGEQVRVRGDGGLEILSTPSPERQAPICRHFGRCGGCVAQHMRDDLYARWKQGIVAEAFAQRGLSQTTIAPLVRCGPGSRRRAVLTAQRKGGVIALGYHARRSHHLVAISECPVLAPAIVSALPALAALAAALGAEEARLTVLQTPAGLDVAIGCEAKRADARITAEIGRIAGAHRFARVSVNGEVLAARAVPALPIGGVAVVPPPGGFVQAVAEAEAEMVQRVVEAVGKAKRVADLFCGLGAFAFALARTARVMASDSDRAAIAALQEGARKTQGLKPIEVLVRDLFRDPLSPKELEAFGAVVLDPPRAGARAQAEALARSKVPVVAYVSCNPATLARDARLLVDGGYEIASITPIDQFLYSAHVEAVAVLRKG